jgi:hypothetical protein
MDLRRSDLESLTRLGERWNATPGAEFEAMLTSVDLTAWQDVIQYLRSLGMRENPQIVKMNICLSNNIRFTLEGAGVIQAYCRDNRLTGKPFTAMLKEEIADAAPVVLDSYAVKAKLKREIPLSADDARVKEALSNWDKIGKHFRNIQRFEFTAPGSVPVRFDVSLVRENQGRPARTFQESRITGATPRYEVEVELTAKRDTTDGAAAARHLVRGISWILQGRQRSYVLVSNAAADYIRESVGRIFGLGTAASNGRRGNRAGPQAPFRYPGPQPATLERKHILPAKEPGVPNVRLMPGGYNVTDKADGLRCLLFVSDNGRIFLVDGGGRVYATGRETEKKMAGLVLDGEWIRRDRAGAHISHYYAFDIMAAAGGDTGVAALPFMVAGAMAGSAAAAGTRQTAMAAAVGALMGAAQTVRGVPPAHNIQFSTKTFRSAGGAGDDSIFRDAAAATLDSAAATPYNTDGLIFTPNAAPLPLGRGTWAEQLKWKPSSENTIDFLVMVERERGRDGKPTAVEAIGSKYREDAGHSVRFKTLRLFVGSSHDAAYADPRTTVMDPSIPLPASMAEGEWREVEFRPTDPRDPMASVCYLAIGEGMADPAGAAPAATALEPDLNHIRTESGDIIQSNMIVEMAYYPERAPGWRWVPKRVRHDKTERWLAQQATGGRKGGTMNADWVANSIWNSIHNPVTREAITSGIVEYCPAVPAALFGGAGVRRTPARDALRVQCFRNFVEDWVKRRYMYGPVVPAGGAILDMAMGNGTDINRWIASGAAYIVGATVTAANLNDPADGAYRRLLDKMVSLGGRAATPPMVFVQADGLRRLTTGDAGLTPEDQGLLNRELGAGGPGAGGFDVVSAAGVLSDACRDEATMAGFLTNVADTLKVGGYLVGYGLDGDAVARLLRTGDGIGRDGHADVWAMMKRYGTGIGSIVPPSAAGLGLAVDVDFISDGTSRSEFLVSWPYMMSRFQECGIDSLTPEECGALGLPTSTQMFAETLAVAAAAGENYAMSPAIRGYADLHRWFVLKRRVDRRPAPPAAPIAAPAAPIAVAAEEAAAAAVDVIELGEAAVEEVPAAPAAPPKPFVFASKYKVDPEARLGADLADWPWYLSFAAPVELTDLVDASITYSSVEAAVDAARYQRATDKPELGRSYFSVMGQIHQKREPERAKLDPASPEFMKLYEAEAAEMRVHIGGAKLKALKAAFNQAAWDAQKIDVYRGYLQQRYERDARFRAIIEAIRGMGAEIMFANGTEPNELGVGVLVDGTVVGGENKVGKIMTALGT